jgi:hypothetical protein
VCPARRAARHQVVLNGSHAPADVDEGAARDAIFGDSFQQPARGLRRALAAVLPQLGLRVGVIELTFEPATLGAAHGG